MEYLPTVTGGAGSRFSPRRFVAFAWAVLLWNILVSLWGAYVRASGSGNGCGDHWPLCDGKLMPMNPKVATLIELFHRMTSGIDLVAVALLLIWAWRIYPKRHRVRTGALLSAIFLMNEAFIGAALVLFQQVGTNASLTRAGFLSVHLINTFLLLGVLTLTAWWASGAQAPVRNGSRKLLWTTLAVLAGTIFLGVSGAIAALGDTLFPAKTLAGSMRLDFSHAAPMLLRARVFHPLVATIIGLVLIAWAQSIPYKGISSRTRRLGLLLTALVLVQAGLGVINISLLAPIWMQIVHLTGAYVLWVTLVLLANELLSTEPAGMAKTSARWAEAPSR